MTIGQIMGHMATYLHCTGSYGLDDLPPRPHSISNSILIPLEGSGNMWHILFSYLEDLYQPYVSNSS